MLLEFLDLPPYIVASFRVINLALAVFLLAIVGLGIVYMRDREAYQLSGRYALWGIFFFALGGLVAALANFIPGEQPWFAAIAVVFRVSALIYLTTHVVYNIRHAHKQTKE